VETPPVAANLTTREREIANLIGLGYTNRQIGVELSIAERTAGAHVQNILNKLGAGNRAQIAAWSAQESLRSQLPSRQLAEMPHVVPAAPTEAPLASRAESRPAVTWIGGLLAALAVVVAATDDGLPARLAAAPDDSQAAPFSAPAAYPALGSLVYEARLSVDGTGFGTRYVIGDPGASEIRFLKGAVEFEVVKPGGSTGDMLGMESMPRYFTEARLSVKPGSNVEFLINLGSNGYATHIGDHVVDLQTASALLQLQYLNFADNKGGLPLGPQIHVSGLQSGRVFSVAARVDPPLYQLFLDGRSVVSLKHAPSAAFQQITFGIFGEGGMVRLTSMKVFQLP